MQKVDGSSRHLWVYSVWGSFWHICIRDDLIIMHTIVGVCARMYRRRRNECRHHC